MGPTKQHSATPAQCRRLAQHVDLRFPAIYQMHIFLVIVLSLVWPLSSWAAESPIDDQAALSVGDANSPILDQMASTPAEADSIDLGRAAPAGDAADLASKVFLADSSIVQLASDGIYVFYFHHTVRCPDCIIIEAYAKDVLAEDFPEAVEAGDLIWQEIDFDLLGNAHFQERYGLELTSIVLSRRIKGCEVEWLHLDEAWELLENGNPLTEYFLFAIEDMLYLEE